MTLRGPRRLRAVAASIVLTAAAGIGLASAHMTVAPNSTARWGGSASNTSIEVRLPPGWERLMPSPRFAALGMHEMIAIAPAGRGPGLVVGVTHASDPSLLRTAGLAAPLASGDVVALGSLRARRYRAIQLRGWPQRLTVYALPTNRDVVTVACPADPLRLAVRCEEAAATLTLLRARSFPLGPDPGYARSVNAALSVIDRARASAARTFGPARTGARQARVASRLEIAHDSATQILRALSLALSRLRAAGYR